MRHCDLQDLELIESSESYRHFSGLPGRGIGPSRESKRPRDFTHLKQRHHCNRRSSSSHNLPVEASGYITRQFGSQFSVNASVDVTLCYNIATWQPWELKISPVLPEYGKKK